MEHDGAESDDPCAPQDDPPLALPVGDVAAIQRETDERYGFDEADEAESQGIARQKIQLIPQRNFLDQQGDGKKKGGKNIVAVIWVS